MKPGCLVRIGWYDEIFGYDSYWDEVNEGWKPKGIETYKNWETVVKLSESDFILTGDATIPFGTKGLLFMGTRKNGNRTWCQVLWGEQLLWIYYSSVILEKESTNET